MPNILFMAFWLNRNKPKPDNFRCEAGLALGRGLHEDACFVSEHIGRYSTRNVK